MADYQIQCLVARETQTPALFSSIPRGSYFKTVSSPVRSHCCLSAKSFLCCQWSRMEGKAEQMGVVKGEGGKTRGLPHVAKAT